MPNIIDKETLFNNYPENNPAGILISRKKGYQKIQKKTDKQKGDKIVPLSRQFFSLKTHINSKNLTVEEKRRCLVIASTVGKAHNVHKNFFIFRMAFAVYNFITGYGCSSSYGLLKSIEKSGAQLPSKTAVNANSETKTPTPTSQTIPAPTPLQSQTPTPTPQPLQTPAQTPQQSQTPTPPTPQQTQTPTPIPQQSETPAQTSASIPPVQPNQNQSNPIQQKPSQPSAVKRTFSAKLPINLAPKNPPQANNSPIKVAEHQPKDKPLSSPPNQSAAQKPLDPPKKNNVPSENAQSLKPINQPVSGSLRKKNVSFYNLPNEEETTPTETDIYLPQVEKKEDDHFASSNTVKTFLKNVGDKGVVIQPDSTPPPSKPIDLSVTEDSHAIPQEKPETSSTTVASEQSQAAPETKKRKKKRKPKQKSAKKELKNRRPENYIKLGETPKKQEDPLGVCFTDRKGTPNKQNFKALFEFLYKGGYDEKRINLFKDFVGDPANDAGIYEQWGKDDSFYLDRRDLSDQSISLIFNSIEPTKITYLIVGLFNQLTSYKFVNTIKGIYSLPAEKRSGIMNNFLLHLSSQKDSKNTSYLQLALNTNVRFHNSETPHMQFFFSSIIKHSFKNALSVLEAEDPNGMSLALASLKGNLNNDELAKLKDWANSKGCKNEDIKKQALAL